MTHAEARKVRYLCPVCFEDSGINMIKYPRVQFNTIKDYKLKENIKDFGIKLEAYVDFFGTCNSCGYPVTFLDIDEGMVDIIQYLNNNGYNTIYCCEGHIKNKEKGEYDYPYLIMECQWDDKIYYDMIKKCPDSWEIFKTDLSNPNYYTFNSEFRFYCRHPLDYPNYLQEFKDYVFEYFPVLEYDVNSKYKDNYEKYGLMEDDIEND